MKKYVSPQVEKISFSSKEAIATYSGCYTDTWLTGSDAGDFYCPTNDPYQMDAGGSQCWNAPAE